MKNGHIYPAARPDEMRLMHYQEHQTGHSRMPKVSMMWCANPTNSCCRMHSCLVCPAGLKRQSDRPAHSAWHGNKNAYHHVSMRIAGTSADPVAPGPLGPTLPAQCIENVNRYLHPFHS